MISNSNRTTPRSVKSRRRTQPSTATSPSHGARTTFPIFRMVLIADPFADVSAHLPPAASLYLRRLEARPQERSRRAAQCVLQAGQRRQVLVDGDIVALPRPRQAGLGVDEVGRRGVAVAVLHP